MLSKTKRLAVLIFGLAIPVYLASQTASRPIDNAEPSLDTLKTLVYTPSSDDKKSEAMGYSALRDLINACRAYSKALTALLDYHEPVLTRGETGMAVFRKISPSVVMVVAANLKDDKITDSGLGTGS